MLQSLFNFINDPLYRLAISVLLFQTALVGVFILLILMIRSIRSRLLENQEWARHQAQNVLMRWITASESRRSLIHHLSSLPKRPLFEVFERFSSRLGPQEKNDLKLIAQELDLEEFAHRLAQSWLWWRRLEGVLLLGSVGTEKSIPLLRHYMRHKDEGLAFHSAWSFARIHPLRAREFIFEYLNQQGYYLSFTQKVRLLSSTQLQSMSVEESQSFFESCSVDLKPVLIEAFVLSAQAQAVHLVKMALKDPLKEVRIAAFKAASLSRFNLRKEELLLGIEDSEWEVRAQAVKAAGELRSVNLIPAISRAMQDSNWWVRQNASRALIAMKEPGLKALSYISEASPDRFARQTARFALSEAYMNQEALLNQNLKTAPLPSVDSELTPSHQDSFLLNRNRSEVLNTVELRVLQEQD